MGQAPSAFDLTADLLDPPALEGQDLEEHQKPPPPPWRLWLLEGGRGAGKSFALAHYTARYMRSHPGCRARIIAPTYTDAVESMVRGPSGLLTVDPTCRFLPALPGGSIVRWPNQAEALVLGTYTPRDVERLRATGNRELDVWEEMAANPQLGPAWDMAKFGLRLGEHPHSIAATTPRPNPDYKRIRKRRGTIRRHATLFDNPHNPQEFVEELLESYGGTHLGRTELYGELVEDAEGALWSGELVESLRIPRGQPIPTMRRIVVGVDPAASSGPKSHETGLVVVGLGENDHLYVLADRSARLSPVGWAEGAIRLLDEWDGDRIVPERNNGGEMVEATIHAADPNAPVKSVWASRGKRIRAEPIATYYERGLVHHVGVFAELESEMTGWEPADPYSPNRLDALVWACTELKPPTMRRRVKRVRIGLGRRG